MDAVILTCSLTDSMGYKDSSLKNSQSLACKMNRSVISQARTMNCDYMNQNMNQKCFMKVTRTSSKEFQCTAFLCRHLKVTLAEELKLHSRAAKNLQTKSPNNPNLESDQPSSFQFNLNSVCLQNRKLPWGKDRKEKDLTCLSTLLHLCKYAWWKRGLPSLWLFK